MIVLSAARCRSSVISDVLNLHPNILSVPEVFSGLASQTLFMNRVSGKGMGKRRSRQNPAPGVALSSSQIGSEIPHTFGGPQARFSPRNSAALAVLDRPQLTTCVEILYHELETLARVRRSDSLKDPYLFEWLRERFGKRLWVERSGDSQSSVPRPARLCTGSV